MKKILLLLVTLFCLSLLIGCGGGSSDSGSDPTPTKPQKGIITGTIMDTDYNALEDINVALYDKESNDPITVSVTQSDGKYTFKNLPTGTYKILAYSDDYEEISNYSKYEKYNCSSQGYTKDLVVKNIQMNPTAKTSTIKFKGDKGSVNTWTPDNTGYTTSDGRSINTVFFETGTKTEDDAHDFNMYVKFGDGSISLATGTRKGTVLTFSREIPICNYKLTSVKKGNYKAQPATTKTMYISNVGTYVVVPYTITSTNPMFTTSYYKVSPEFGWFVEYNNDGETFTLSN